MINKIKLFFLQYSTQFWVYLVLKNICLIAMVIVPINIMYAAKYEPEVLNTMFFTTSLIAVIANCILAIIFHTLQLKEM